VPVDPEAVTELMHARLHVDLGTPGQFDYPGEDVPVQVDGQILTATFHVSGIAGEAESPSFIIVQDLAFSPQVTHIFVNDIVTWQFQGNLIHTVTADDETFDSGQLGTGDVFEFTFLQPGEYPYHCQTMEVRVDRECRE
jgi:plastocyanin